MTTRTKISWRTLVVLTPEEKRAVCFVLMALIIGLTTKHYRDTHAQLSPESQTKRLAHKRTAMPSSAIKPRGKPRASPALEKSEQEPD